MSKKKGLLADFDLLGEDDKPDEPVHVGDYLEETTAKKLAPVNTPRQEQKLPAARRPAPERAPATKREAALPAPNPLTTSGRTRLNITDEQRDKLDEIVHEMHRVGPERYLKASEVVDALLSVLHDAREHRATGMQPRRGKLRHQQE